MTSLTRERGRRRSRETTDRVGGELFALPAAGPAHPGPVTPAPFTPPLTVLDVMVLLDAAGIAVESGRTTDLDRRLTALRAVDGPDAPWLPEEDELLVVRAGALPGDAETVLPGLAERGCPAVLLLIRHDAGEDPGLDAYRDVAARLRIGVIVARTDGSPRGVAEQLRADVALRDRTIALRTEQAQRRLTRRLLDGADTSDLLAEVAAIVGNPVLLAKGGTDVFAVAGPAETEDELQAAWDEEQDGRPTVASIHVAVPMGEANSWGRLVAFAIQRPLAATDLAVLERAAESIGLALLQRCQEQILLARRGGDVLGRLARDEIDARAARQRAETMGMRPTPLLLPVAVTAHRGVDGLDAARSSWALLLRDLQADLAGRQVPVVTGLSAELGCALVVVGLSRHDRRTGIADELAATVRRLGERHLADPGAACLCVGPAIASWGSLGAGLREVVELSRSTPALRADAWHDTTKADVELLLRGLADRTALDRFAERRLEPLVEHDLRRKSQLLLTLEMLFAHNGNKADTARALHLERQSLYHRLQRIEDLLGESLADENTRLGIHLALRLRRFSPEPAAE